MYICKYHIFEMHFSANQLKHLYNKNIKNEIFRKNNTCIFIIYLWNPHTIKTYSKDISTYQLFFFNYEK